MTLTPEDVVNKRFNSTKFREGYDQDEVDDFLDEVVVELRRLIQENQDLRQQLSSAGGALPPAPTPAPAPAAPVVKEPEPVPQPTPVVAPAPIVAPAPPRVDAEAETNSLLHLARKLHDEHVHEGEQQREKLIAEGRETAARMVADAEAAGRRQREQFSKETAGLQNEKANLERRIEELRVFEAEYRTKLRSYIESQLRELETANPIAGDRKTPAVGPGGR